MYCVNCSSRFSFYRKQTHNFAVLILNISDLNMLHHSNNCSSPTLRARHEGTPVVIKRNKTSIHRLWISRILEQLRRHSVDDRYIYTYVGGSDRERRRPEPVVLNGSNIEKAAGRLTNGSFSDVYESVPVSLTRQND